MRGRFHGDFLSGQDSLQSRLRRAAVLLQELTAVAEHPLAVDHHGGRGPIDAEQVGRAAARVKDNRKRQPVLLEEGRDAFGCLVEVGAERKDCGLALIVLVQLGEQMLHISATMASRAPERQNDGAAGGALCVLLQLAELNALAVEGSYREIRHFIADLDAGFRRGFVTMLAVPVMLMPVMLVPVMLLLIRLGAVILVVLVLAVYFPLVSVRLGFGMGGTLVTLRRLLVAGFGSGDGNWVSLRAAAEPPRPDQSHERQGKHMGANLHDPLLEQSHRTMDDRAPLSHSMGARGEQVKRARVLARAKYGRLC